MPSNNKSLEQALREAREFDPVVRIESVEKIVGLIMIKPTHSNFNRRVMDARLDEHAKDEKLNELVDAVAVAADAWMAFDMEKVVEMGIALAALKSHLAGEEK